MNLNLMMDLNEIDFDEIDFDFDENGTVDPIVTYFHKDKETPFASKDELVKQMPYLNKEYLSYKNFAKASLQDLFSASKLNKAGKMIEKSELAEKTIPEV